MPRVTLAARTWPCGHVLATLFLGTALGACFNPPAAAVMFSCTPDAPACPAGYTCEADGCCHRDGDDLDMNFGACGLGNADSAESAESMGPGPTTTPPTTDATTSDSTGATGTSSTSSTTTSSSTSDTSTDESGTTADTSTSADTSTGDTSGSSGTGTT